MRFTRWYPLTEAADNAPATPGVLQVRLATGLIDYPRGKSAMVHYAVADDVRDAALRLASEQLGPALWCRHLDPEGCAVDYAAEHARLVREFENRFGSPPSIP